MMKLKSTLIVVKDMEKALKFYQELFGMKLLVDNDGNMLLQTGLLCRQKPIGADFSAERFVPKTMPASCILRKVTSKIL